MPIEGPTCRPPRNRARWDGSSCERDRHRLDYHFTTTFGPNYHLRGTSDAGEYDWMRRQVDATVAASSLLRQACVRRGGVGDQADLGAGGRWFESSRPDLCGGRLGAAGAAFWAGERAGDVGDSGGGAALGCRRSDAFAVLLPPPPRAARPSAGRLLGDVAGDGDVPIAGPAAGPGGGGEGSGGGRTPAGTGRADATPRRPAGPGAVASPTSRRSRGRRRTGVDVPDFVRTAARREAAADSPAAQPSTGEPAHSKRNGPSCCDRKSTPPKSAAKPSCCGGGDTVGACPTKRPGRTGEDDGADGGNAPPAPLGWAAQKCRGEVAACGALPWALEPALFEAGPAPPGRRGPGRLRL